MNRALRYLLLPIMLACTTSMAGVQGADRLALRSHNEATAGLPDAPDAAGAPLRLGISTPDYPPLDITHGQEYEGLSADYAALVGQALGRPIVVQRYPNRDAAVEALRQGDIDLLPSANGYEAAMPGVALSDAYAVDRPVLVARADDDDPLGDRLAGRRLSVVNHYLPDAYIKAQYPKATVTYYPSYQNALNAVAFEQADVFLGDTISTHYQIDQGLLNNVRMVNFSRDEPSGFSFAARRGDPLLAQVNQALAAIAPSRRESIFQRWSGASDLLLTDRKLQLTPREERWLAAHPSARVVVDDSFAPLTFFDRYGNLRGVSADLLELVRLRTGLQFEIGRATGVVDMVNQVQRGQADIIAAIIPSEERAHDLQFSRPYLSNSYVLVTARDRQGLQDLGQFAGRRLAITRGNPLVQWLREHYPDIQVQETDDAFASLDRLAQGQADGAISALVVARPLLASPLFQERLAIRSTVGTEPARFALATGHQATELASILDKALLSIGPQELTAIAARWRSYSPDTQGSWRNYHRLILQIVAAASVLLLALLVWIGYMRRQIRQRVEAERALGDQLQFMRALVDGTPHPIYVRDDQGLLLSCNDSYLKTFNARRDEVLGKTVLDGVLIDAEQARAYHLDYLQVMARGEPMVMDRPLRIGDQALNIYHWILPYRDSGGRVRGVIGGWIDVSERRQLLEDLRQAKEQADQANRAKSTFLATMSHEIRTPMNALIGMLELALRRADRQQLDRHAIEVAYGSARDLLNLIGDILDVSRIEAGHLSLKPERVQAGDLVRDVARIFEGLARDKGLALQVQLPVLPQPDVMLDPLRFKQVLSNLVSNAIKFTDRGHVRLELAMAAADSSGTRAVRVTVSDTGIGISAIDRQRLFQPFAQVDPDSRRARSGTGLGLVISQNLSQLMGARLTLDSQPGEGTRIELLLPALELAPLAAPPAAPKATVELAALRVLVVDDHPANRLLMTEQLGFLGLHVETADNGLTGLAAWQAGAFDVLFVDGNMPGMNGYDMTRQLRRQEQQAGDAPCVVFGYTASALPQERERCLAAGMNDCLFKPISLADLTRVLATVKAMPCAAALDLGPLAALTGGQPALERRLLQQVLDSCVEDRQALLTAEGCRALSDLAHRIKGAANIVAAAPLIQACEALEQACESGDPRLWTGAVVRAMQHVETIVRQRLDALPEA